jgi:hypothetical protein
MRYSAAAGANSRAWLQPQKYNTDIAKAKAPPRPATQWLRDPLVRPGFATVNDRAAVLTREVGADRTKTTINKSRATWRRAHQKEHSTPTCSRLADYPEYFFIWCYPARIRSSTR